MKEVKRQDIEGHKGEIDESLRATESYESKTMKYRMRWLRGVEVLLDSFRRMFKILAT